MKRKIVIGVVVLAVVTMISGASLMAFATPGTPDDPLISLSYLTDIFRPQVSSDIERAGQDLTQELDAHIADLEERFQASQGSSASSGPADAFTVVTLRNGQSLTCSVGVEIMLRIGTANGFGTAPALINYTTGATLSSGSALTINNMYLVTIEGNGIRATADTVRVLVRGSYTIT